MATAEPAESRLGGLVQRVSRWTRKVKLERKLAIALLVASVTSGILTFSAMTEKIPGGVDAFFGQFHRLDAVHRTHLVERYFPHASHQVILLSTDEEIDEGCYAKLEPWVGRTYRLDFDDAADATQVQQGYFW